MKTNKIMSFILVFAIVFNTIFIVNANSSVNSNAKTNAKSPKNIYTLWTGGSSTHTGNGSESKPFNMLEDAIAAANDGDTIIIKSVPGGAGAFLNIRTDKQDKPFIIDKDITIKSEPNSNNNAETINFRLRGLILNANLTLENVSLSFQQKMHDHIFVNGHTLTLKNVKINNGTREVDIFGGSAHDKNTKELIKGYDSKFNLVASKPGTESVINIINDDTTTNIKQDYVNYEFGKIFAGSMNSVSNIPVTINIKSTPRSEFETKGIFASGAEETYVNLDDFMNLDEPVPPTEKPNEFPLNAELKVNLNRYFPVKDSKFYFDGNGANKVDLAITTSDNGIFDVAVENIDSLTLDGKISFSKLVYNNHTNSSIKSKLDLSDDSSELDLSKLDNKNVTIDEFIGGGKLRVARNSSLTINETATGETKLLVGGFGDTSEYISALPTQTLITTPAGSDANFTLLPNASQTDEVIIKKESNQNNNEWKVISTKEKPEITEYNSITFTPDNPENENIIELVEDTTIIDWLANLVLTIDPTPENIEELDKFINLADLYVNDKKITKTKVTFEGDVYLGWNYKAISFMLEPSENNTFTLFVFARTVEDGDGAVGTTDTVFDYTYEENNKIKLEVVQDGKTVTSNEAELIIYDKRNSTSKVDVAGITINESKIDLNLDNYETKTIGYTIEPDNATNKGVTFESDNTDILEVTANGELIPKNKGTATVKIISEDNDTIFDEVTINISKTEHVQGIEITNKDSISQLDLKEDVNNKKSIQYEITPTGADNQNVRFEISDPDALEIDVNNGELTPKKVTNRPVTVTIITEDRNFIDTVNISIVDTTTIPVQGVKITNKNDISELNLNDYTEVAPTEIKYQVTPSNATDKTVTFKSSDEACLLITKDGGLIPKSEGTATVTITTKEVDGNGDAFVATAEVTIVNKEKTTGVEIKNKADILELDLNGYTPKTIKYKVTPDTADNTDVTFISSDEDVLEVGNDGELKPKKVTTTPVEVTIRTVEGGHIDTVQVSIIDTTKNPPSVPSVQGVKITNKADILELDLNSSTKKSIEYKVLPEGAVSNSVTFTSSSTEYLEVDNKGVLTPKKVTTTPVNVTVTVDGAYTDTATVKIVDKSNTGDSNTPSTPNKPSTPGGGSSGSGGSGGSSGGSSSSSSSNSGYTSGAIVNSKPETENTGNTEKPTVGESKPDKISIVLPQPLINQPELTDIATHWAKEEIKSLQSYNIITGFSNNEFKPDLSIKRGDLFVIIDRILKLSTTELESNFGEIQFKDLSKDKYYYNSINNLVSKGIVSGFSDNTIRAEQEITREELAKIIKNLIDKTDIANITDKNLEFKDNGEISNWASDAIKLNTNLGIITGYPDNTFKPKNKVTRAETAVIIKRLLNIIASN